MSDSTTERTWSIKASRTASPIDVPPELANQQQYEILRELGRGGMGVVYLARNKLMDRLEVLKVVNKSFLDSADGMGRFLREIQSAAKLRHENVVGAYSALQLGGVIGFAMEYVEGQDLARVVEANGPLSVGRACDYVRQAALGLQHAHEKGMIHRDIKPQNLILSCEGKKHVVKVLDFGLAKATRDKKLDTGLTGVGMLLGTPDYMAPEQILDAATADIRSDVYSLGCTLYFLLSGKPPFRAKSVFELLQAHQSAEATPLDHVRSDVPANLANVVARMMAKDPARRFQTPGDVARALTPFLSPESAESAATVRTVHHEAETDEFTLVAETVVTEPNAPHTGRRPALKRRRRGLWIFVGVATLALLALGVIIVVWATADGTVSNVEVPRKAPTPQPPPPKTDITGLLVLDNCDPDFKDKPEYKDNLTFWDPNGVERFRVSGFNNCEAVGNSHRIAVDGQRKAIWVIENAGRRVRRFDLHGKPTLTIDGVRGTAIAVDPETGNAWVVGEERPRGTFVYDPKGDLVASYPVTGMDIVHDAKSKSFWIADHGLTKIAAGTGEVQFSKGISGLCVSSVSADPRTGGVWAAIRGGNLPGAGGNRLLKFDASGREAARVPLGEKDPYSLSVDSNGSVWVACMRKSVDRFSPEGARQASFPVAALAVRAAKDGGVWVVTPEEVQKLSAQGEVTAHLPYVANSNQAWLAPIDVP